MATEYPARTPLWIAQMPQGDDGGRRIRRLLIANRGEIACRVIKTCRLLGITSIAIYADEDDTSRHVADADEAIGLGSVDQSVNPFLNIPLLVETATRARADAIHPGYGYLSENSLFADAVRNAGVIFVGPSSTAMSTLGDKRLAKQYLAEHEPSIPLIPGWSGSTGEDFNVDELERHAEAIGYPIMIKASAGGGGKGMRIVREPSALRTELERARSEAQRSFGSSDCILEKYIEAGKHVEVQIMGDSYGTVLSLWERDCSVQRRHQKVIEESPCLWLAQEQREAMCAAAVRIGKLLGYESAGTVEFILDIATGNFYFLELFVASGGNLAQVSRLSDISQKGHAIECRLCAEDPIRDFAPQHGLVHLWAPSTPGSERDVRFETALDNGARVSIYFDSMVAKIVVWAPTRSMAIDRMVKTLAETACIGPKTNQLFLQSCLLHKAFHSLDYTTSFIPSNLETLLKNPYAESLGIPLSSLSTIPGIFLREVRKQQVCSQERPIFQSIRRGFRNQRFDRVNLPCDIITTYDAKSGSETDPQVCFWNFDSQLPSTGHTVQIAPLTILEGDTENDGKTVKPDLVTKTYNTLSAAIRKRNLPDAKSLNVKVFNIMETKNGPWKTGRLKVSVEGQTILAHIACIATTNEPDAGGSTTIFMHAPILGAPIQYHVYSPLSFFESLRFSMAEGGESGSKTIGAPMPCKVLQVLKKNGEDVKIGEVVMIVESMKMEITIVAGREGKFQGSVKEGGCG